MNNTTLIQAFKQRVAQRTDSEFGQALVRLAILTATVVYFATDYFSETVGDHQRVAFLRLAIALSVVMSIGLFAATLIRPTVSAPRRIVGMIHDVIVISAALYFGGQATTIFSTVYLWITLGNGIRYGNRYLYGCAALSVFGFALVYSSSDYWSSHGELTLNVLIALVVLPLYAGSLLRSFHAAKDQLELRATVDPLTGLLNRAEFEAIAGPLFINDRAEHVLIFCDLDRFKEVNDIAGHAAGDKILADVGDIILGCVRKIDVSARVGGDEFCVLLRDCSLEKGREVAETIRSEVSGYRLAWGTAYHSIGISIGVAPSSAVKDVESLFRLADAACYAAKNAGRNKVHVVDPRTGLLDTQKIRALFDETAATRKASQHNR